MNWIKDPLTLKKIQRFRSIKRGYFSFLLLIFLIGLSLVSELLINNRALLVRYNGSTYFPTYGAIIPGTTFGLDYEHETDYRDLQKKFAGEKEGNFVLMPVVPYSPNESDYVKESFPPYAPSAKHFLGTDSSGRDILARLFYGFRIAIFFSMLLLVISYAIGITVGCMMGYLGGRFDLIAQRVIEIWSNIPTLYLIIIVASVIPPSFTVLLVIMIFFYWVSMTWYMRTATYKEKTREYILAAKALGAGHGRIIFSHIIPNTISIIVTFMPFTVASGITALTALDYLGF
ncbi:MAG: ABC transporter permease subunit, partial [Bdellovibrionales bacterium]|nr:ABC transporter permease subunit [Bdellovibrionales bacterium]